MNIDATYKRAVRIVTAFDQPHGKAITIFDRETGEKIFNVASAVIHLQADMINMVELTYYERNEHGEIITVGPEQEPSVNTISITSDEHEVDVTAFEV